MSGHRVLPHIAPLAARARAAQPDARRAKPEREYAFEQTGARGMRIMGIAAPHVTDEQTRSCGAAC